MSELKLRTRLESCKTLCFTNYSEHQKYAAGEMAIIGDTVGVVVESVGTYTQKVCQEYPNGNDGVLVYEAEKIVLPKKAGASTRLFVGQALYYDEANGRVTNHMHCPDGRRCGLALDHATDDDTEILANLIVLA